MASNRQKIRVWCPECDEEYPPEADFCPEDGTRLREIRSPQGSEAERDDPFVGRTIDDRFTIDGILGAGGMARVYRATQTSVDRPVAVKILRSDVTEQENAQKRFFREAEAISTFSHPNIVNLIDFGRTNREGALYLVMELIEGHILAEMLDEGRLAPRLAVHVARQICGALAETHVHGVVHRDLKPGNVMMVAITDGRVQAKLVDFGIAHALQSATTLTDSGAVCGTPFYMAPEQAVGDDDIGPAVDIYALGVMLYEMLTGWTPLSGSSALEVMYAHAHEQPPPLSSVLTEDEVPGALADLVHEMLRKPPAERPESALAVRDRLEAIERDEGYDPVRVSPNPEGLGGLAETLTRETTGPHPPETAERVPETGPDGALAYETGDDLSDALASTVAAEDETPPARPREVGDHETPEASPSLEPTEGDDPGGIRSRTMSWLAAGATALLAVVGIWWLVADGDTAGESPEHAGSAGGARGDTTAAGADAETDATGLEAPDLPAPRLAWASTEERERAHRLNAEGLDAHQNGEYRRAAEKYRASIRADPSYLFPRYNLACALQLMGRPGRALGLLRQLRSFGTSFASARLARAREDSDLKSLRDDARFRDLTSNASDEVAEPAEAARTFAESLSSDDMTPVYEFLSRETRARAVTYPRIVGSAVEQSAPASHSLPPDRFVAWLQNLRERDVDISGWLGGNTSPRCREDCCSVSGPSDASSSGVHLRKVCVDFTEGGHPEISSVSIVARYRITPPSSIDTVATLAPSPTGAEVLLVGNYGSVQRVPKTSFTGFREYDIWSFDPPDSELERLTDDRVSLAPDWAPDGERFAFVRRRGIAVYHRRTGRVTSIRDAHLPEDPDGEYDVFLHEAPAFGPRGRFIAFEGTDTGSNYGFLFDTANDCLVSRLRRRTLKWSANGDLVVHGANEEKRRIIPARRLRVEGCPDLGLDDGN